ncbi:hypothetical protein ACCT32_35870, partial [Rhizobium brockwellii]|uniref:hypothetical protein n=1 Tax=Rhizobium brockwellii TaxID=3019932 RepID=UPI003F9745CD
GADFLLVGLRPTKIFESNVIARYIAVFIEPASCHAVGRPGYNLLIRSNLTMLRLPFEQSW